MNLLNSKYLEVTVLLLMKLFRMNLVLGVLLMILLFHNSILPFLNLFTFVLFLVKVKFSSKRSMVNKFVCYKNFN